MFRRVFRIMGLASVFSAALAVSAFAATAINTVNFSYTIEGDQAIDTGYNEPEIQVEAGAAYTVSDLECVNDTSVMTGKTAVTYTMTLSAKRNYYFPKAAEIQVNGTNITQITKTTVDSSDNTEMTIKFKAYPYYALTAPAFVTEFKEIRGSKSKTEAEGRGALLTIDKKGASKIEYVISYVDQYGEVQNKKGSSTGSSISVSAYNKQYTGTSSSRQSAYIRGIAIRAAGTHGSNPNAAPSEWVYIKDGITSIDTEEYFTDYHVWDDLLEAGGNENSSYTYTNGGVSGGTSGTGSTGVNVFGWSGSGDNWYYYSNGNKVTGWIFDGSGWYYCNPSDGLMKAGWINDGGHWYFLNTLHDGSFGRMVTGWIKYNGITYYLKPNAGGPQGSMVTGPYLIDGIVYNFTADGALIG